MEPSKIRILLVDDQPAVRVGLKMLLGLEDDMQIVGEADNGENVMQLVAETHPDVVVMDLHLPGMDGISTTTMVRNIYPQLKVIMLSIQADQTSILRAYEAGASAYVEKRDGACRLIFEIRKAFDNL